MSYLLDTNVVSEFVKARPSPQLALWLDATSEDELYLSVVTVAELRFGIESMPRGQRRDALMIWLYDQLIQRFERRILAVDQAVAEAWGVVMGRARKAGRPMAAMDGIFAASSEVHGLTLVTRDARDFQGAGISLLSPW
ncbi:MAG: type II toxin-antitoxin system VapC family toxin [Dongiaceae bacterium]